MTCYHNSAYSAAGIPACRYKAQHSSQFAGAEQSPWNGNNNYLLVTFFLIEKIITEAGQVYEDPYSLNTTIFTLFKKKAHKLLPGQPTTILVKPGLKPGTN